MQPDLRPGDIDAITLRVEYLTPHTFKRWTDGSKWILDTMNVGLTRPDGVGKVSGTVAEITDFLQTYPHPVGTFYVFATHLRHAVEIAEVNPMRDIRFMLMPKEGPSVLS